MILIKINYMANKVLGMHRINNKVKRNAFDLSHRHMFTAQVGELLPVFSQWVNPNETFKIGYNGKTRTAALNSDAFTRIRENIQYYFVPFQSLWYFFEQQVNNMTKGDAGQNIAKIALNSSTSASLTTAMPYISYVDIAKYLDIYLQRLYAALNMYFTTVESGKQSITGFYELCARGSYSDVFVCEGYRLCRAAKLLMSLGYGNFSAVIQYDGFAMANLFIRTGHAWSLTEFKKSEYALDLTKFEAFGIENSPNMSIFPLLAYHKICNDHYRNEKWQPYEPWTCNIDYLTPTSNMNANSFLKTSEFSSTRTTLFDLENSNLPIDYFTSVLPRAQYGDESAVVVTAGSGSSSFTFNNAVEPTEGALFNLSRPDVNDGLVKENNQHPIAIGDKYVFGIKSLATDSNLMGFRGKLDASSLSVKLSALRSATALQKYKEIQNSNDPDFASQVLAHFGIKPKVDSRTSVFIGGDDKTLSINPQVNTNFQQGGLPDIKAIGVGDLSAGCKFTATTYGIIIGIYRAVPQLDYAHVGIDRNLFKTDATDFPIPELDSIGMQTQYRCELSAPLVGLCKHYVPYTDLSTAINMSLTYGYAPRYAELKSARDYFEGGFCGSYKTWVTGYDQQFLSLWRQNSDSSGFTGPLYGINDLFKCRPSLLYPIFVNQWSGTVNDDKLLIGSVNTCVAVRPFSMFGLPYSK